MYYLVSSLRTPTTISKSENQLKSANKFLSLSLLNTVEKMSCCDYFQCHRQMIRLLSIKLLNGYFFFLLQLLLALNNIMHWLEFVFDLKKLLISVFMYSLNKTGRKINLPYEYLMQWFPKSDPKTIVGLQEFPVGSSRKKLL